MIAGIHSYADESVLANGHWVKIRVSETGVCRMSYSELHNAGLDPAQVRVFGFGGTMLTQDFMQPKIDDLPEIPVYRGNDYILFYVQGAIGWQYTGSQFAHTRNPYSNYGYYFLTDDSQAPAIDLTPVSQAEGGSAQEVSTYFDLQLHEIDTVNLIDRFNNKAGGGRDFYGESLSNKTTLTCDFLTPSAAAGQQGNIYVAVAASASSTSSFQCQVADKSFSVNTSAMPSGDFYTFATINSKSSTFGAAADKQTVTVTYNNSSAGAIGWLDYIELQTPCSLTMSDSWILVRSTEQYKQSTPLRYRLNNATSQTVVWDVTNPAHITPMATTLDNGQLTWTGSNQDAVHTYAVTDPTGSKFVKATVIGQISNQNLHSLRNIDYVIICPEGYEQIATDLAKAHEQKQAITWAVVTDQEVFNEFSSGTPDATAYRWLMKMLYDRAGGADSKPRWLLLMGDGTFDNRQIFGNRESNGGKNTLLTYQAKNSVNEVNAYATDDYFGFLDDNEGEDDKSGKMDIGVGRLPVNTTEEARAVVDKLVRYMANESKGKWKNQLVFLSDDGNHGEHTQGSEESAEKVRLKNPDFVVNKIYLDAYPQEVNASGESYPLAKNRLLNLLKGGALYFNYSGHGGYNAITNESLLNLRDIEQMTNTNQAFWLFATCSFAHFDSGNLSAAEAAVLNPNGGAIAVLSADRTVYATPNRALSRNVSDTLFGHANPCDYKISLGEAVAIAKNMTGVEINKLSYVLLGDPALVLNYPTDYQVETITEMDTLNALSVQQVDGRIVDADHQPVDFNGKVDITVYDKLQVITTRDNDSREGEEVELAYNDYPSIIFSGTTDVKQGLFHYTFMTPKDIRYNYGNGRIVYYAYDTEYGEEAVGHFENFVVGGTGAILQADTLGPDMRIYLNSPAFVDGGKTYATPRFFADLYDENGINTAGAGIGHDLMLIIDDNPKQTYSLNEYFTAEQDSYQKGQVSYLITELEDGPHSLTFRAWDLLNNSTTKSLNFVVESGIDPSIYSVITYPNPVQQSGVMNMTVLYDQPDELLSTEVYLFNVSGQMVWSHQQNNPEGIQLNLGEMGLQPGVYIYNIRMKAANSRYSNSSGKIIVTK